MMKMLMTALATPYLDGKIDKLSYEKLVCNQIENKVDALLALGTTAESLLLTDCEKKLLLKIALSLAAGMPVYAGVDASGTDKAAVQAQILQEMGANGLLICPPSFCKCTAEGYYEHICRIAERVQLPLILYNAPERVGYSIDSGVIEHLKDKIAYVKDAGKDAAYTLNLTAHTSVLCGNDEAIGRCMLQGCAGAVSVLSNAAPQLTRRVLQGEKNKLFDRLTHALQGEINPIGIKYLLYKKGIFSSCEMRLPLTAASERLRAELNALDMSLII